MMGSKCKLPNFFFNYYENQELSVYFGIPSDSPSARLSLISFVFCVIYGSYITFGETTSLHKEPIPHTIDCLWYNELMKVSNLNLTVLVTDGYKYKDLEQV